MAVIPFPVVEGAPRQPFPSGLFSAVSFRPEGDGRWQLGVTWQPDPCAPLGGIGTANTDGGADPQGLPKDLGPIAKGAASATPLTVYGHAQLSSVAVTFADAQLAAERHLIAREQQRVEQAFWTGDLGNTPSLMKGGNGVTPTTLTAGTLAEQVGTLEDFILDNYGSLGVIHTTVALAEVLASKSLVKVGSGGRITTPLGTPIVAGAGYTGAGPGGSGTNWAYVTPAIFGYRSETFNSSNREGDLMDRGRNNTFAIAERTYVLGFDPCGLGAIQLTVS